MAEFGSARHFTRIERLPPYVFNITAELKMAARLRRAGMRIATRLTSIRKARRLSLLVPKRVWRI